jgi:hypothetical protein
VVRVAGASPAVRIGRVEGKCDEGQGLDGAGDASDHRNPTSNRLYQAIGYGPVAGVDDNQFCGIQAVGLSTCLSQKPPQMREATGGRIRARIS